MDLLPVKVAPEQFCKVALDLDMYYLPWKVVQLGALSQHWVRTSGPTLKIYTGRPGHLQLFHHPLPIFVEVAPSKQVQAWKAELCSALHQAGVEAPIPTSNPYQNFYNGSTVARRTVKATHSQVSLALKKLGVSVVWVAQYGGKVPLQEWLHSFKPVLPLKMQWPIAFDLGVTNLDGDHIYLFGVANGKATVTMANAPIHAYMSTQSCQAWHRHKTPQCGAPWSFGLKGTQVQSKGSSSKGTAPFPM